MDQFVTFFNETYAGYEPFDLFGIGLSLGFSFILFVLGFYFLGKGLELLLNWLIDRDKSPSKKEEKKRGNVFKQIFTFGSLASIIFAVVVLATGVFSLIFEFCGCADYIYAVIVSGVCGAYVYMLGDEIEVYIKSRKNASSETDTAE